jgi:hypothetical protein
MAVAVAGEMEYTIEDCQCSAGTKSKLCRLSFTEAVEHRLSLFLITSLVEALA